MPVPKATRFSPRKLKQLREARGLRREEIAVRLGCSVDSVKAWEAQRRTPTLAVACDLAAILGCAVDDLLETPAEQFTRDNR